VVDVEKGYPELVGKYKTIVDSLPIPILILKLDMENFVVTIEYFNANFQDLSREFNLFPIPEYKIGDSYNMLKTAPGTKTRSMNNVLGGLKKLLQKQDGETQTISVSLFPHNVNPNELDVKELDSLENQVPFQMILTKLAGKTFSIAYKNMKDSNGNGLSNKINNLINLTTTSQGVVVLKEKKIDFTNTRFVEMLGYDKPNEVIEHSFDEFMYEEDCKDFDRHLENLTISTSIESTCRFKKKDTSLIWLRLNCGIVNLGENIGDSLVINTVDVTEKKKTELALFQTHRMASIGELSSGVAHEINNPLFGIMNYAGLVKDAIDEGEVITKDSDEYEFITGIIEESERIAGITNNLSEFSRNSEERDFEQTDLTELVQKVENVLKHRLKKAKATIEKKIAENFPKNLRLQKQRIRTALFNMVLNSIQAVDPVKGRDHIIKINLEVEEKKKTSNAVLKIWDNGIGIDDDKIVKVFDPFYTSNRSQKTGLGLHTVYQIIMDHKGDIRVSSKLGHWTEFTIRFPIKTPNTKKK